MKTLSFIPLFFLFLLSVEGPEVRPAEARGAGDQPAQVSSVTATDLPTI